MIKKDGERMRIKLYVVTTDILNDSEKLEQLEELKLELIQKYQGLTETTFNGYWFNEGRLFKDVGFIWELLGEHIETETAKKISLKIKLLTNQESQLISFDSHAYPLFQ